MELANRLTCGEILWLVHECVARGLKMSDGYSAVFCRSGFPDETTRSGFSDYVRTLASVMRAHIISENELVYPRLRPVIPDAPYELLVLQHSRMAALLGEIWEGIEEAYWESAPEGSLAKLNRKIVELGRVWPLHAGTEETHFTSAKIGNLLGPVEEQRLAAKLAELNLSYAGPDYLVVPFTLFNLPRKDRVLMAGAMPPLVVQHLVPGAWKEKWRPMMPFLLV